MLRLATSLITVLLLVLASPRIAASAESVHCFEHYCDLIPGYSHYPLQAKAGQPLFLRTPEPVRKVVAPQGAQSFSINHVTSLNLMTLAGGVFKVELGNGTVFEVELTPSKEAPSFASYGSYFTKELARVEDAHRRAETERMNTAKAIAALSLSRSVVVPVDTTYSQGEVSLLIESGWHWSSDEFVLSFALTNTSKEPVEVGSIVTRDLSGKAVELIFKHLEISGPLQPGSDTRGAVILPKETAKQYDTLELTISSATFVAGLGVMVLSSSAEAIGGATAPDLGWSLAFHAYGSIGVERRFDWFVIGAGIAGTAAQKSISAIEAGAHIGLSFKP